jgi:hypothetical protein
MPASALRKILISSVLLTAAFIGVVRYFSSRKLMEQAVAFYIERGGLSLSNSREEPVKRMLDQLIRNHTAVEVTRLNHPNGDAIVYALPMDTSKPFNACGIHGQKFCFLVMEHPSGDRSIITVFHTMEEHKDLTGYTEGYPLLEEIVHYDATRTAPDREWVFYTLNLSWGQPDGTLHEEKRFYDIAIGKNEQPSEPSRVLIAERAKNGDFSVVLRSNLSIPGYQDEATETAGAIELMTHNAKFQGLDGIIVSGNLHDQVMTISTLENSHPPLSRTENIYPIGEWPMLKPVREQNGDIMRAEILGLNMTVSSY